jgi:cytochrome b561
MAYGGLEREAVAPLMAWHKFLGVIVLAYGLWRMAWRMRHGFPEPDVSMPRWQEATSKAVHVGLLAAIVAMPLSGILMTIAGGRALTVWGMTLLPSLGEIAWLDATAGAVHETAPPILLLLLALHVGGALKHHFLDRDATLRRMIGG